MSVRNRVLTVFGRKPVLEALEAPELRVERVLIARKAGGAPIEAILAAARARGVTVERVGESTVTKVARNGRHHQGVVADVVGANLSTLEAFLDRRTGGRNHATSVLVLDHVHNPSNVGMIIRSATAAGIDGIVVPRAGTSDIGPLVIKASAGVAFHAPIIWSETSVDAVAALAEARFTIVGLAADTGEDLFSADVGDRVALILGNETEGVSAGVGELVERWVSIPVAAPVESLNVACAATLAAYHLTGSG